MRGFLALLLAALIFAAGFHGTAAADDDYDRARRAFRAGEVRPLGMIVASVQHRCGARVIGVELEEGIRAGLRFWVYQLRMIRPNGNVLWVDVDAATMAILRIRGWGIPIACR